LPSGNGPPPPLTNLVYFSFSRFIVFSLSHGRHPGFLLGNREG